MLASQARRFAEALVDRHVISRHTLDVALTQASETGQSIDDVIASLADISPKDLAIGHAAAAGLDFVDLDATVVHSDASTTLAPELARTHTALGIDLKGRTLTVAFGMPANPAAIKAVGDSLREQGFEVNAVGTEVSDLLAILDELEGQEPVGLEKRKSRNVQSDFEQKMIRLIEKTVELGASDLHLTADEPPFVRILGELARMPDEPALSSSEVRELAVSIISSRQRATFEETNELDTSYAVPGKVRLRVNLYVQRGAVAASLRVIPFEVVPFEQLGIPEVVATLANLQRGLVLVTGPTGSGKSTTLASLIDLVNQHRSSHVITIEDPIEFVHHSKRALIHQREVGNDTAGFGKALTQALRQDPDVVLVGEMRDLETVRTAVSAAETGHLVFATLHTQDAAQTVDRIVDVFPPEQQTQVRTQLAGTLQAIVTQQLVRTADGESRIPAVEVLLATPALRSLVRDGKVHQIPNTISSGRALGMQTMDDSLAALVNGGYVTHDEAMRRARDPQALAVALGRQPVAYA